MKTWNLGNTTVRNPDRIKEGLRVFKKYFEGRPFTEKEHLEFCNMLIKENVIESKKDKASSKEISGRKWAACFNQLGFARALKSKGTVVITDAGNALLSDEVIDEEVFLRQFLKYHLPSPIEGDKKYYGFDVNPLFVILSILNKLSRKNIAGLTKEEIGLYVITCIKNSDIESAVRSIIKYRNGRQKIKGRVVKKRYYSEMKRKLITELYKNEIKEREILISSLVKLYKKDKLSVNKKEFTDIINKLIGAGKGYNTKKALELKRVIIDYLKKEEYHKIENEIISTFVNTKAGTLNDYADTTVRYTVKTGLLSIKGETLILKEDKKLTIESLVENFKTESYGVNNEYFYSSTTPALPTDNVSFMQTNISYLNGKLSELQRKLSITLKQGKLSEGLKESNPNKLKRIQRDIEQQIVSLKEKLFYLDQSKKEQIEEILDYYEKIENRELFGGEAYLPAYLEWTTWRVFLAINNIINDVSKTRGFNIDEELNPIHHAKGGDADMIFEYEDFVIAVEVTLLTGDRQGAEDEPIPRHVAKISELYPEKDVYCIFLAPKINLNTLYAFRTKRIVNGKPQELKILPMTITQIKDILRKFERTKFTTSQLRMFLDGIFKIQSKDNDALEWYDLVNKNLESWIKT